MDGCVKPPVRWDWSDPRGTIGRWQDRSVTLVIASINVNGLRAALRKGMRDWLAARAPDIVTMQEVRAPEESVPELLGDGWHVADAPCSTAGRAGVAIATRGAPTDTQIGFGKKIDDDRFAASGRWVESTVPTNDGRLLTALSAYVQTGDAKDDGRMEEKHAFLASARTRMQQLRDLGHHVVLTGDLNVAHHEVDIKNGKGNRGKAGFLEEERAHFDALQAEGWVDLGRALGGDGPGPYTWWSWRGRAYDNDAGWRIDYQIASPDLAALATEATVDRAPSYDTRWSDHAPVVVTYDLGVS